MELNHGPFFDRKQIEKSTSSGPYSPILVCANISDIAFFIQIDRTLIQKICILYATAHTQKFYSVEYQHKQDIIIFEVFPNTSDVAA